MAESRAETKAKLASTKAKDKDAAEAKAAKEKKEADDEEAQGKVEDVEDVLQPTGGAEGSLEESKAKEAEAKGEDPEDEEGDDASDAESDETPKLERDLNAEAAPFAGTAVAGSTEKTFAQQGQLYTDGLSGDADHNLDRAYGSGA